MKKIFTLIAAALMAVNVSAANKVLKITGTADKVNPWDSQCYINLKNLEKGKAYVVKFAQFKQKQRKVNMREMNCKWLRMSNIS